MAPGMWPFSQLRKRRHDRRYRAALIVYLGSYLPDRLDPGIKQRLEDEVSRIIKGDVDSAAAFRRWASWQCWGTARAVAMANLGIEPPIPGLKWTDLLRGWNKHDPMFEAWDSRVVFVLNDFWPLDPATAEARNLLRRNGFDIPDQDPVEKGASDTIGVWGDRVPGTPVVRRD